MAVWICLLIGVSAGAWSGGWGSASRLRRGDLPGARAALAAGRWSSAIATIVATFVLLGWPFKREMVGVPEEITTTLIETVTVPKTVYDWYIWPCTVETIEQVPRQVVRTIFHEREIRGFSAWLLFPMAALGWLAFHAEAWAVHLVLRRWG
jgi:hypothetical protein